MPTCWDCGEEIEFRYIDGRPTPIHPPGSWCQGDGRSKTRVDPVRANSFEDVCRPTVCRECGKAVFFIRHNGGSVWVDELGWPWPKHGCCDKAKDKAEPPWFSYVQMQQYSNSNGTVLFGVVIQAKWLPRDDRGPPSIILAVDGGDRGRVCLATTGMNTADYLLGRVAIVDVHSERLVTSNKEVRPILRIKVRPEDLGLPRNWATLEI